MLSALAIMNYANQILRNFLKSNRLRSGLTIEQVADNFRVDSSLVDYWEQVPIRAPLYQIAKLVELYNAERFDFQLCMLEVQSSIRLTPGPTPLNPN